MNRRTFVSVVAGILLSMPVLAESNKSWRAGDFISHSPDKSSFCLSSESGSCRILADPGDWAGVVRAANDLAQDIGRVTGRPAELVKTGKTAKNTVIVGTIGHSALIDGLIKKGKLDVSEIKDQWESYIIQTVGSNLVVAGSDKRGTIYGIYDISEQIGVSPWYWWADVPAKQASALYVKAGRYVQHSPKVRYRGIFINDENPSFGDWAREKYSREDQANGINSDMYAHMFELILRLKGNYLWPAMWGKAFNEDDPLNPAVADEYGVVMGTSHHEPMMRAQQEYTVRSKEVGAWDYVTNSENLQKFWREGLERNSKYENVVTVGMRGDGDVAMGKGDDASNIEVLHQVLNDQRAIISDIYKDRKVPQMWALFTEVQRYYDAGMQAPDDIMLLFCDNNWGYIRRTGPAREKDRSGGMGLYYHIDMNGGPWNDRWINTTTFPKLREQLGLAYSTGIDDLWIINVGDLKPKELPIDFIMHYAWNPDAITANDLEDYTVGLAQSLFGEKHAKEIAYIISRYPKLNLLRKPEIQSTRIFSHTNYDEAARVSASWKDLTDRVERIRKDIPKEMDDAFYQLVYYPVVASAGVMEMYIQAGLNNIMALQGNPQANAVADNVLALFEKDKELAKYYNTDMAGGKWKNMMSDIHVGYISWSMPRAATLPSLYRIEPLDRPSMAVTVEGSELAWPVMDISSTKVAGTGLRTEERRSISDKDRTSSPSLPVFDIVGNQTYRISYFNRGTGTLKASATAQDPWIKVAAGNAGTWSVSIDWAKAPQGKSTSHVNVSSDSGQTVKVEVTAVKNSLPSFDGPYYGNYAGEFAMDAIGFSRNIAGKNASWVLLPDLGRGDGCMGISPVTAPSCLPADAPRLEYDILVPEQGTARIFLGVKPTQDVNPARGLRIAVGIDGADPVELDARKGFVDTYEEYTQKNLARSTVLKPLPARVRSTLTSYEKLYRSEVFDDMRWLDVELPVANAGIHTLKIYMVDPELVIEKIVVNPDGRYSYFGPTATLNNTK